MTKKRIVDTALIGAAAGFLLLFIFSTIAARKNTDSMIFVMSPLGAVMFLNCLYLANFLYKEKQLYKKPLFVAVMYSFAILCAILWLSGTAEKVAAAFCLALMLSHFLVLKRA